MKLKSAAATMLFVFSVTVYAECTSLVRIESLWPREGGWIHIKAVGVNNIDIMNCGAKNDLGMLLNYNDISGTLEGKKMLYSTLLAAFSAGKMMKLCSDGCDSQHPVYSRLSHIDDLQ